MSERIKELRYLLKLTQQQFADKIGVKTNTVAVYEMGIRNPKNSTIYNICNKFNVSEDWLRDGIGEPFLTAQQVSDKLVTINQRVRAVRATLGLSMEQFGIQIGVMKSSICNIENARSSISNQMIKSICREFNVSEEWLRNGTGEMHILLKESAEMNDEITCKNMIIGTVSIMSKSDANILWNYIKENFKVVKQSEKSD